MTKGRYTLLPQWGILEISGADAKTFLQGQITFHMDEVHANKAQLAGHCNLKGRLQNLFYLLQSSLCSSTYFLLMPKTMILPASKAFKKFALFSKVNFIDQSEILVHIGVFDEISHAELPHWEYPGHSPRWMTLVEKAKLDTLSLIDISAQWEHQDVNEGFPMVYPETVDMFLPHHLNLDLLGAISLNKGCYLGQEIIARMHYKGNIKKHLYKITMNDEHTLTPGCSYGQGIVVRDAKLDNHHLVLAIFDDLVAENEGYVSCRNT